MDEKEKNRIERIRAEYEDHEVTKIEELEKLNKKVHLPGHIFGYTFGCVFVLVFGAGMSMVLGKWLNEYSWSLYVGIAAGVLGLFGCVINPFIVKKINLHQRKKYQKQILDLSAELLAEKKEEVEVEKTEA